MTDVIASEDYLTEAEVLARWTMIRPKDLRRARRQGDIDYYAFVEGPCYTPHQVQEYIDRTHLRARQCEKPDALPVPTMTAPSVSPSADISSSNHSPIAADIGTPAGMTSELAACVGEALASKIKNRPRSSSRRSSPPHHRPAAGKPRLALIKS